MLHSDAGRPRNPRSRCHSTRTLAAQEPPEPMPQRAPERTCAGADYEGKHEVGKAFTEVFETFPDAQWRGARHFLVGDRGL